MVVQVAWGHVIAINHCDLVFDKTTTECLDVAPVAMTFELQFVACVHVRNIDLTVGWVHRHIEEGVTHTRMTLGPGR